MTTEELSKAIEKRHFYWRQLAWEAWDSLTPAEREKATIETIEADVKDTLLAEKESVQHEID